MKEDKDPKDPAAMQEPASRFDLSRTRWEQEHRENAGRPWRDSPETRLGIRMFSRGILGAIGFTFGGWYARRATGLRGYTPETWQLTKPLHVIAKTFDTLAGKPIKAVVNALGYDGEKAVRFRPTSFDYAPGAAKAGGRTLGEEVVGVTTDFSMMSWGDALGRDLADIADPRVKKDWQNEDGSIDSGKALHGMAKAAWRYTTYNAGEDWAVGLPYAYWMKGTRHLWNKAQPGFRYDFDRGLNGGSFKVDRTGSITGNYQIAGLLNLQERFTAYNIGTLMYREAYNTVAARMQGKAQKLYGGPDQEGGVVDDVRDLPKWVARAAIKGVVTMTPAVPFFWITRTPQSKYKGRFINPDDDTLLHYHNGERRDGLRADQLRLQEREINPYFRSDSPVEFRTNGGRNVGWQPAPTRSSPRNPFSGGSFSPYGRSFGPIDAGLNAIGRLTEAGRLRVRGIPRNLGFRLSPVETSRYWNAAMSYTPYMWAKAESGLLFDNAKTDLAAERLIDGAAKLNWGEFKAGAAELMSAIVHEPLSDPAREREAQRRMKQDLTPPDTFLQENIEEMQEAPGFAEKVRREMAAKAPVVAPPAEKRSHAEQLALRDMLSEMTPPTPTVH